MKLIFILALVLIATRAQDLLDNVPDTETDSTIEPHNVPCILFIKIKLFESQ